MTTYTQKQQALIPFIKLLESKGELHTERFVGMGFHDDKFYLLKLNAKPEEVVARGEDFYFHNKKGDGPAFGLENNQTLDQAATAYRFFGSGEGHGFVDFLMVPQTDMERTLMIASLKSGLASVEAGHKPNEGDVLADAMTSLFAHPDATAMMQEVDPTITDQDVNEARDILDQALAGISNQPPAAAPTVVQEQAPSESTEAPVVKEAAPAVAPVVVPCDCAKAEAVRPVRRVGVFAQLTGTRVKLTDRADQPTDKLFNTFGWTR